MPLPGPTRLNLPITEALEKASNVLVAGMGGGFDVYCGIPLAYELRAAGKTVHWASLSFSAMARHLKDGFRLSPTLVGTPGDRRGMLAHLRHVYYPELFLAEWLTDFGWEPSMVWTLDREGAVSLVEDYRTLLERLQIDALVMVDGGVDSLVRGDEAEVGTAIDDTLSLAAAAQLAECPVRILAALGLGTEQDLSHGQILENIAGLTAAGAFLGGCSLVRSMDAVRAWEAALESVFSNPRQDPSVINTSVRAAVQGRFGDHHATEKTRNSRLWINPWMAQYWFFDLPAVAERSHFVPHLTGTHSFAEARQVMKTVRAALPRRAPERICLE